LKLETQPIEKAWRIKSPSELIKITTKSGRKLKLTKQTQLLTLDQKLGVIWKEAKSFKPVDRIATARTVFLDSTKEIPSIYSLIQDYPKEIHLLNITESVKNLVEKVKTRFNFSNRDLATKLEVSEDTLYRWKSERRYGGVPLSKFNKLCEFVDVDVESCLPENLRLEVKRGRTIVLPRSFSEEWFYIMGLIIGDGRISVDGRDEGYGGVTIGFSNRNTALLNEFSTFFEKFGFNINKCLGSKERADEYRIWSSLIYHIFTKFGLSPSPKSDYICPNPDLLFYPKKFLYSLLRGLFDSDGWISTRETGSSQIGFSSTSKALIQFVQKALLTINILGHIRERKPKTSIKSDGTKLVAKKRKYELTFNSFSEFTLFKEHINFNHPQKKAVLIKYCRKTKLYHRNTDTIPELFFLIKELLRFYNYKSRDIFGRKSALSPSSYRKSMLNKSLTKILNKIDLDWHKHHVRVSYDVRNQFYQEISEFLSLESIEKYAKHSKEQLYEYFIRKGRNPSIPIQIIDDLLAITVNKLKDETKAYWLNLIDKIQKQHEIYVEKYNLLNALCNSDIYWDEIAKVEVIHSKDPFVYDLTIPNTHNFLVNGIIVHNTAAVIREAETGEMSLEAGALVLADKGICGIDEIDKMSAEDRVAIHEALEQHTISIAKAGIIATLNARTSVLAAANPKLGRFNPFKDPIENVNLPPTLLSRFDLLFIMQDRPDADLDARKAEHILNLHRTGTIEREPPIEPTLLTKYIAHARQNIHPRLSVEAAERIREYYKDLRSESRGDEEEGGPPMVAITPRQLEALVRLSEARAKMGLREEVLYEDASAIIRLMDQCMNQLGRDIETGRFDADRLMTGQSTRTRSRIVRIEDLVYRVERRSEDGGKITDIVKEAEEEGLDERDVVKVIEDMKRDGLLYEPKEGWVKKI
ncbi:MAG: LAGLIDADG family homing endonuclease, partial [Promethearchaeota archaeon]